MYKRGLKQNVQNKLAFHGGRIDDLDDLTQAAIHIDEKLHLRNIERAEQQGRYAGRARYYDYGNHQRREPYDKGDPMELDVMRKPQHGQKGGRPSGVKGNCYRCGKPGHITRNCKQTRNNDSVQPMQLNVMRRRPLAPSVPDDDDDSGLCHDSDTGENYHWSDYIDSITNEEEEEVDYDGGQHEPEEPPSPTSPNIDNTLGEDDEDFLDEETQEADGIDEDQQLEETINKYQHGNISDEARCYENNL